MKTLDPLFLAFCVTSVEDSFQQARALLKLGGKKHSASCISSAEGFLSCHIHIRTWPMSPFNKLALVAEGSYQRNPQKCWQITQRQLVSRDDSLN